MTFKVKDGLQVGPTLVLDSSGRLTTGLATPRNIALSGDISGSAQFDGTGNINITATSTTTLDAKYASSGHTHDYLSLSGGTMAGTINFAASQTWPTFNQNTSGTSSGISSTSPQLAAAVESNSIYVSSPTYTNGQITKPLIFDWYSNYWSIGNIRGGGVDSIGFGIGFKNNTPIHIFTETAHTINGNSVWHAGNDGANSGLDADLLDGNQASAFALAGHTHSGAYVERDEIKSFGTVYVQAVAGDASCTTAQFISWLEAQGFFDYYHSFAKCSWDYAGNNDISDTGFGSCDLAGAVIETWTDNSDDTVRGNITVKITRPTTGSGGGQVLIYNDQGAGYSPGWRQEWNSSTDGSGSGLDADLLDGNHASAFAAASHGHNIIGYQDTRGTNINPYSYAGVSLHLKTNTTDGLADGGTYHGVLNLTQWGDSGGGRAHQLGFTDNQNLYYRTTNDGTNFSTWNKIWHAGNDGSGSGLDADLLDGNHASAFALSGHTHDYLPLSGAAYTSAAGTYGPQIYPTGGGGWARSVNFASSSSATNYGSFGALGGSNYIDYVYLAIGTDPTNYVSTPYLRVYNSGFTQASGSLRAPVFYDSNDTGYYTDPSSTSDLAQRIRGGTLHGPNLTWGAYLMVGGDGRQNYIDSATTASVATTNGNLHLDSASGYTTHINWYDGVDLKVGAGDGNSIRMQVYGSSNYTYMSGSARSPIFYDSDDTGYYVDPTATSNLKGLTVTDTITGSITGSAASATYASNPTFSGDAVDKTNITTRTESGFYQSSPSTTANGWPITNDSWQHLIACTHNNDGNYYSMQIAASFFDQNWYFRNTAGSGTTAWSTMLHSGNYNSYAPTLTGTGASGTWGISISGNAATATNASSLVLGSGSITASAWAGTTGYHGYSYSGGDYRFGFSSTAGTVSVYADGNFYATDSAHRVWHAGDISISNSSNPVNPDNVGINHVGYNNSVSLFNQTDGGLYAAAYSSSWVHQIFGDFRTGQLAVRGKNSGTWQAWRTVLDSSNYASYAMPVGASATNSVDIRAPIFYDSNNTGYYVDPASTSVFNVISLAGGVSMNDQMLYFNDTDRNAGSATYYPNAWTRGVRFSFAGAGTTGTGGNYSGVLHFHPWDGTTASTGDASYQLAFGSTAANLNGNPQLVIRNGIDTSWGAWRYIPMYDLNQYAGAFYATIYYDADNTNYYLDPNGTSNLYKTHTYIGARDNNSDWAAAFRSTPTTGYAWHGDMSSGGPRGTWWFYESMRHSNSSNFWGTQIAWGWEDNANELWQRNVSSNSFSSWVRYINTSNFQNAGMFGWRGQIATNGWNDATTGMWVSAGQTGQTGGPGGYGWGGLLSFRASDYGSSHRFQIYASHTGELKYRTGWDDWSYGWYNIWSSRDFTNPLYENAWIGSKYFGTDGAIYGVVFYDANNSGYYVDPNATSNVNAMVSYSYQGNGNVEGTGSAAWFPSGLYSGSTQWLYGTLYRNGSETYNCGRTDSTIMYDSNDTSYYLDGNSESRLHRVRVGPYSGSTTSGNVTGLEVVNAGGTGDGAVAAMSFHCQGHYGTHFHLRNDGYIGIGGWSASSWRWYVALGSGDMVAAGNVTAYSDPRLKEDVTPISSALEKVTQLNGVKFRWIESSVIGSPGKYDYGVMATDVEKIAPELVVDSIFEAPEGDKYKTVAYDKIVPFLIEAIKEQQAYINKQEERLAALERKLFSL